jgi:hypothetical protein
MDDSFRTIGSASVPPPPDSPSEPNGGSSSSGLDQRSCLEAANQICGFYRRDEAHDPETFAAALAAVLGSYPASVVRFVCDPRTGVPAEFPKGLPNVGQIKEFCDYTEQRQHTMAKPLLQKREREYVRPVAPGRRANLFIGNDCAPYAEACKYAETADPADWRHGPNNDGTRHGIWVNANWNHPALPIPAHLILRSGTTQSRGS